MDLFKPFALTQRTREGSTDPKRAFFPPALERLTENTHHGLHQPPILW